jgi:UDP-N-acetylmuramoyl-L-alanyl-D-glutamate--2,6-diaminopimelate ligase
MQALHSIGEAAQWLQANVTGLLYADSRQVGLGDGFMAWPGAASDGRAFVGAALQRGAGACLVERVGMEAYGIAGKSIASYHGLKADAGAIASQVYGEPSRSLAVIAVTGTNGKTSTAWWLAQALTKVGSSETGPCGVIGTLGVGCPPALESTGMTTPDPVQLQTVLKGFVDEGLSACAMEASSIGIDDDRLTGTHIRVAVFTNLTQDHLDYHGSMQAYWQAKRKLFSWDGLVSAVINIDDVKGAELAAELGGGNLDLWTTSCTQSARLQACNIAYSPLGLSFEVREGDESRTLNTSLIGGYNVANLLGVLGAMRSLRVPLVDAVAACGSLEPVPGRMECVGGAGAPRVVVDYAHTPDALEQVLRALRPMAVQRGGQLWCVFGCGGDRDASKRPMMGAIAARQADRVVVTSDNPRSERPEAIVAQILLGTSQCKSVSVQVDRAMAIAESIAQSGNNDVILLAGKGHEVTQEIAGVKHPFSDVAHAALALDGRHAVATEGKV